MSPPTVVALWLDGATCSVDAREAWALGEVEVRRLYAAAREAGLGACVVSTCFRVELFVAGDRPAADLLAWGRRQLGAARPGVPLDAFRQADGDAALRHLLRTAAGLESAVLGEAQILGQVRRARAAAEAAGVLQPALRAAFDTAVRTGQWARRVTDLGRGTASTASAAVQWADDAIGGLDGRDVVVVGAGQIGRLLLGRLAEVGAGSVTLVSAHAPAHAGFAVVRPDALGAVLPGTDVVFTATDRRALDVAAVAEAWRGGRRRVVVDLGVPRNVDDAVGRLAGVTLADIDALGAVVDAGLAARQAAVPDVEAAIEAALAGVRETLARLDREALVADFRRRAEAIRQDTLDLLVGTDGAAVSEADVDLLSRTLTNRLLHDVTAALRSGAGDDDALRHLLHLDDDA